MKLNLITNIAGLLLILASVCSHSALARDRLVLGIHPYKSPVKLIKAYTPLAEYLSRKTGIPVHLTISKDYQNHIDAIGSDTLDVAYMGPASYVKLVNQYGRKPLLACQAISGKPTFQGKIIVRKDSNLRSLNQLKGKSFAFGDPNSTMSHLVPRYMLWKAGVSASKLKRYRFLGSHDNVALAVLAGDYDAGAVKEAVFYKYKARGLKVLKSTPVFSEHVFVASKRLNPALIKKLRNAFLSLHMDSNGREIMNSIKPGMTSMRAVEDKNYNNLREILHALERTGVIK